MTRILKTLSSRKTWLTALGAVVVLLTGALGASAYITTTGSGAATASVGILAAPSITTATPGSHSVVLDWSSVTPPGAGPVTYSVTRLGGTVGGTCPTLASPAAVLTCTDTPLADGTYDYTVTATWRTWTTTSAPETATVVTTDTTAPTATSIVSTDTDPTNAAVVHWTVTFSEDVTGVDAGDFSLARIGVTGGTVTSVTPVDGSVYAVAATTGSGSGTLGVNLVDDDSIVDGAGNRLGGTGTSGAGDGSFAGQVYTVDKTGPANALSLTAQSPASATLRVGNTIFYRGTGGGSGGSFRIHNAVSDSGSGPVSSTTQALGGTATGWSHAPSTVSSPAGGPYDSNVFTWAEGTTSSPTEVVTAADAVGNTTAAETLTLTDDSAAPTGGAITVNGQPAGTVGYSGSASFPIGTRADYTDAGSGLASSTLTVQSHSLSDGACGAAAGPFDSPMTVSGTTQPGGIVPGFCYRYTLTGTDNLGNTTSISTTVAVDASAPSTPAVAPSAPTGNTFVSGSTVFVNTQAGRSGGFTVGATSSDDESGIAKLDFPALDGFASGGGSDLLSPYSTTYAWTGAAAAAGPQTVTATNNAGLTGGATFTVTPDTTAPTGSPTAASVSVDGVAATSAGATTTTTSTAFAITNRNDFNADTGSGFASSILTVQSATLAGGTCGAPGSGGPYATAQTIAAESNPAITTGFCYRYTLTGTDNVGNAADLGVTVIVAAPSLTVDTTSVAAGGTLTATWSGIAGPAPKDWLGLYLPSSPADSHAWIEWIYDSSCTKAPGAAAASGSCAFTIPSSTPAGTYELRLLPNDVFSPLVATSSTFTVTG